jgi:stearoyl-CoA desaturase (delta-9 desaturase)
MTGCSVDMSDLWSDPIVRFQRRFYIPLIIIIWGLIPTLVPYYLWQERLWYSFLGCVCFRYVYVLHATWLVNSLAHLEGHRPYDRNIGPRENNAVIYFAFGEGIHKDFFFFPHFYCFSNFCLHNSSLNRKSI